jgi:hypothetical protein
MLDKSKIFLASYSNFEIEAKGLVLVLEVHKERN